MKKILIGLGIIIVLVVGWYLISPAFIVVEQDDVSPIDSVIVDELDTMGPDRLAEFEEKVEEMKEEIMEMEDVMPIVPTLLSEGTFQPRAYEVAGKAKLIQTEEGRILRFEDFETINGPKLHIYLSTSLGSNDIIDLGRIKATKGNVNYEIDDEFDLEKYNHVLVWCEPFRVLFSYAVLT